jgi:hypothetical protein
MKQQPEARRKYQTPTIRVMDEAEMLAAFQITSAGTSWWW